MTLGECLASGLDPTAEDIQEVIQQENEVVADGPEDDEEELEVEELEFFFASVTPMATPAAMRITSVASEPMT